MHDSAPEAGALHTALPGSGEGQERMISLSAMITGVLVTASMGLFLAAVTLVCVLPMLEAIIVGRKPDMPDLPAILENLGIALAFAGFTFRITALAATGAALALLGAGSAYVWRGRQAGAGRALHPVLHKAALGCGLLGLGALGEYYYLMS